MSLFGCIAEWCAIKELSAIFFSNRPDTEHYFTLNIVRRLLAHPAMDTYFIRHSSRLDISEATRQRLWDDRLIAIHYPEDGNGEWVEAADNESLDPADYCGHAKQYMSALHRLATDGGYVLAEYFGHSDFLIGTIPPSSGLALLRGEWGSTQRVAALKTAQLRDARILNRRDHSVITASRPRQGTISRWHAVGDAVAAIIEGRVQPLSWGLLSSARQEVGCSEFLRLPEASQFGLPRLQSLLLPVGRTLKDVDFVGIATDGKRVFAQVTASIADHAIDNGKLDSLRQFVDPSSHVVLFCSCAAPSVQDGIHIFPVEQVFRTLDGLEWGQHFLRGIT